jgi:CubicO group peptidase (beta-lactamase class C family)
MNVRRFAPQVVLAATLLGGAVACDAPLIRTPGERPGEWTPVSPAEVGMDGEFPHRISMLLQGERGHGIHSMIVVRRGKLVMEEYWSGYDRNTLHDLRSTTKSITSLITGIAIDQGFVRGVSDPMLPYLAAAYPSHRNPDPAKQQITLEHLLTMRSGLDCDDSSFLSRGQEDKMYLRREWVQFFLDLPVAQAPGVSSRYGTSGVVALGRVLAAASARPFPQLAQEFLFGPLGIEHYRWSSFGDGRQTDTGGHLYLRPRDAAKIGQLVLQRGQWQGRQIVSPAWIEKSTSMHAQLYEQHPYGYLWWLTQAQFGQKRIPIISAQGNGGQFIFVIPEFELVVVFTGGNYNSPKTYRTFDILSKYVLRAVLER